MSFKTLFLALMTLATITFGSTTSFAQDRFLRSVQSVAVTENHLYIKDDVAQRVYRMVPGANRGETFLRAGQLITFQDGSQHVLQSIGEYMLTPNGDFVVIDPQAGRLIKRTASNGFEIVAEVGDPIFIPGTSDRIDSIEAISHIMFNAETNEIIFSDNSLRYVLRAAVGGTLLELDASRPVLVANLNDTVQIQDISNLSYAVNPTRGGLIVLTDATSGLVLTRDKYETNTLFGVLRSLTVFTNKALTSSRLESIEGVRELNFTSSNKVVLGNAATKIIYRVDRFGIATADQKFDGNQIFTLPNGKLLTIGSMNDFAVTGENVFLADSAKLQVVKVDQFGQVSLMASASETIFTE